MHRPSALEKEITWNFVVSLNFKSGSVLFSPAVDYENHCGWNRREEMLGSFPLYVPSWSWKQANVSHPQGTMRTWKWRDVNSLTFLFLFFYHSRVPGTRRAQDVCTDRAAPWKGRHRVGARSYLGFHESDAPSSILATREENMKTDPFPIPCILPPHFLLQRAFSGTWLGKQMTEMASCPKIMSSIHSLVHEFWVLPRHHYIIDHLIWMFSQPSLQLHLWHISGLLDLSGRDEWNFSGNSCLSRRNLWSCCLFPWRMRTKKL